MSKPSYKDIILSWKDRQPGGRVPIPSDDRISAFLDLIANFLYHGYSEEEIKSENRIKLVIHHSHNPNHSSARSAKRWADLAEEDFYKAMLRRWPIGGPDSDQSAYAITRPEEKPYTPPLRSQSNNQDSEGTSDTLEETNNDSESSNTYKEYSKEEWDKIPTPEPDYDPELRALLGYKE